MHFWLIKTLRMMLRLSLACELALQGELLENGVVNAYHVNVKLYFRSSVKTTLSLTYLNTLMPNHGHEKAYEIAIKEA